MCTADITFVGTSGVHKFYFSSNAANASHVKWEAMDYDFDKKITFPLDRAFTHHGKHPSIVELPLPRVPRCTEYHNPTRPSHLVGGAFVRCRRSYSPSELRPVGSQDLEQSPAYFTRRNRSVSRTPHRPRSHSRGSMRSTSGSQPNQRRCRGRSQGRPAPVVLPSPPRRSDSEPVLDRSRSSSPTRDYITTPLWKWQLQKEQVAVIPQALLARQS